MAMYMRYLGRLRCGACGLRFRVFSDGKRCFTSKAVTQPDVLMERKLQETCRRKTFAQEQADRLEQAHRSILIKCPQKVNKPQLLKSLAKHGNIAHHHFFGSYETMLLLQFERRDGILSVKQSCSMPRPGKAFPFPARSRVILMTRHNEPTVGKADLPDRRSPENERFQDLLEMLRHHSNINGQLEELVQHMQLTEEDIRLRFLVSSLLQDLCTAILPSIQIQPFGSSVNLFGRVGCDLDMFLDIGSLNFERNSKRVQQDSPLEFQVKMFKSERQATQTILSLVGKLLRHISPSFDSIQEVLKARCPVLRFCHSPSNLNCDLTASNRIALYMSETLKAFAQIDARVRPLVFAIRCWARAQNLTSSVSGTWITNFSLTLLVLFFLQQRSPSVIPTISDLRKHADRRDHRVLDGMNCTIVSDLSKIAPSNNEQSVEDLLHGFFDFYGSFPFQKKSINLRTGQMQRRSDNFPMEIINPFEENLNVSKNVNVRQLVHFVELSQNASWKLEKHHQSSSNQSWGLMTLLQHWSNQQGSVTDGTSLHPRPKAERFNDLYQSLWSEKNGNSEEMQQTRNSSPQTDGDRQVKGQTE
uniref:poly(A) RNA polymerase, mitochondrial n=1 Tax=Myxine glutinosa TaxID=7769 RepID=UPI00358F71C3